MADEDEFEIIPATAVGEALIEAERAFGDADTLGAELRSNRETSSLSAREFASQQVFNAAQAAGQQSAVAHEAVHTTASIAAAEEEKAALEAEVAEDQAAEAVEAQSERAHAEAERERQEAEAREQAEEARQERIEREREEREEREREEQEAREREEREAEAADGYGNDYGLD